MTDLHHFIQSNDNPYLILFILDFRTDIENTLISPDTKTLKDNLLQIYRNIYKEVKSCAAPSRLYDDVQWCVFQKLFCGVERKRKLAECSISSTKESSDIAGVKRLLDEETVMNWSIPECSADGLIVGDNQSNINKLFFDYQISCLENFKLQQFYNWRTDIQKLLSLSSIIFLDGVRGTCDFIEDTTYQCLYDLIFSEYREAGQLSSDIITSLQDIVWEYQKQFSHWTTIKKVVEVYEKYKTDKLVLCILETILALLPEMTIQDSNRSEMHVQSSYVHNLTKSIFKTDPWHHPHCSNKSNNFYGTRPDYLVGISTQRSKLNNVFGECKGRDSSLDSCNKDKYRLALFSQVAMQQQQLKSIISFFSLDNEVTFYIMKKTNDLYYFVQIAKIVIPTTESTFKTTGSYFGEIASIRQIYTSQCHEEDAAETEIKPLPWTVLTNMTCKK